MFKIGDYVRRIDGKVKSGHNKMVVGDTDIVVGIEKDSSNRDNLSLKNFGLGHAPQYFELIECNDFSYQLTLIAKDYKNG